MLLDGKKLASQIKESIRSNIINKGITPGLGVIIVGDRKDSALYVRMKNKACNEVGITSKIIKLSENVSTENVLFIIDMFNSDNDVHGILVQLPLPEHINEDKVLSRVAINKDVDGFHATNIGNLAMEKRSPLFVPCTPKGCLRLLEEYNTEFKGKNAVVIGKSNIVGLPISLMLMKKDATVTVCHKFTKNLREIVQSADILISACGQAEMIKGDWLKEGVIVVDIGISHVIRDDKNVVVGDVCFDEANKVASYITPVPGGVGPMTVAMLMENTMNACLLDK